VFNKLTVGAALVEQNKEANKLLWYHVISSRRYQMITTQQQCLPTTKLGVRITAFDTFIPHK